MKIAIGGDHGGFDLKEKINVLFKDHPGSTDYLWMPTNREEALSWMEVFFSDQIS